MSIDLDRLERLALARIAVRIEKMAGPLSCDSVQEHEQRIAELEACATQARCALQEHCEHDFPGRIFSLDTLTFCCKCGAEAAGRTIDDLQPISPEELDEITRVSDLDN